MIVQDNVTLHIISHQGLRHTLSYLIIHFFISQSCEIAFPDFSFKKQLSIKISYERYLMGNSASVYTYVTLSTDFKSYKCVRFASCKCRV